MAADNDNMAVAVRSSATAEHLPDASFAGRRETSKWLLEQGIESVSLNPDSVIETWLFLAIDANDDRHPLPVQSDIPLPA